MYQNHLGCLTKHKLLYPTHKVSGSVGVGIRKRIFNDKMFSGAADVVPPETTLETTKSVHTAQSPAGLLLMTLEQTITYYWIMVFVFFNYYS